MQRWQCLILNSTLDSVVWSTMNQISICVFKNYNVRFYKKVTCAFLLQENILELLEINTIKYRETNIFHIIDQIKVFRVLLWIRHCYLCMEGHLKLYLYSPFSIFIFKKYFFSNTNSRSGSFLISVDKTT